MGRTGSGVEVRERSIRFTFIEGKPTLMVNGKPAAPTPANVKWAHRLAAEMRNKLASGTFSMLEYFPHGGTVGEAITVGKQLDTWLAAQRIKTSTKVGYQTAIRFWKAELADKPLRSLKRSDVLVALANHPKLSGKTINNRTSVLTSALKLAVLDKLLPSNPLEGLTRAKQQKPPLEPFTADEAERIVTGAAKHYPGQIANLVEFWFRTGLRTSELFGLKWSSIDGAAGTALIREARVAGVEEGSTKTSKTREVRLDARATAALALQKAHTFVGGTGHIFIDPYTGKPWANTQAFSRRCWAPLLKRLAIPHRRPYNIRHTRATEMLMAGVNPAFAARQLGHDVNVYLTVYAKWLTGANDVAEMAKLECSASIEAHG
jgi:integrase